MVEELVDACDAELLGVNVRVIDCDGDEACVGDVDLVDDIVLVCVCDTVGVMEGVEGAGVDPMTMIPPA